MKGHHLKMHIVEELLAAIESGSDDISMPELEPEELERYSEYLFDKGMITLTDADGDTDYLETTESGKALLKLLRILNCFDGELIEDEKAEAGAWTPERGKEETLEWHNRLFLPFILEQAEVTRLEAQLKDDYDDEAVEELEQRHHRMETLKNLLETMQRLTEKKPDSRFGR